jgi:hypothetical protein
MRGEMLLRFRDALRKATLLYDEEFWALSMRNEVMRYLRQLIEGTR